MLSPKLRSQVHQLWTRFWSAGMTNPLVAVEQITYLLFLRQLERLDAERVKQGKASIYSEKPAHNKCKWSYIREDASFELFNNTVFPWLRNLEKWLANERRKREEAKSKSKNKRKAAEQTETVDQLELVTNRLSDAYFVLDPNKTETLKRAISDIDKLFSQLDSRSANADIMGDVFEHLLDEIQSSGKNGQFRTPRHIIRFMVELLDPKPGARILDPASGTAGFLINTLLHWRSKTTDKETLRLEWDGTPHRAFGDGSLEKLNLNDCFTGYDNDRTMVRIGWMNLILHGIEFPRISQLDSLSKRLGDNESSQYDYVLANPPFTGAVDEADLSENRVRFPSGGKGGKSITTKSELLFVWLILDLLKTGGRAAVVVPDGVLFGSTNAHRELRRQLLFENTLEAVVSLPAGVFQPYAGVKTSILVFQKVGEKPPVGENPRTNEVWFYEIEDEAFTLDQRRRERFEGPNDLWDAAKKFKTWRESVTANYPRAFETKRQTLREQSVESKYFQPHVWKERWRAIDDDFLKIFPEHASQKDHVLSIGELFGIPNSPDQWMTEVREGSPAQKIFLLLWDYLSELLRFQAESLTPKQWKENAPEICRKGLRDFSNQMNKLARDEKILEREFDQFGWNALQRVLDTRKQELPGHVSQLLDAGEKIKKAKEPDLQKLHPAMRKILCEFAKLDGYDVWLRSLDLIEQDAKPGRKDSLGKPAPLAQSWIVPVRSWAKLDSWGEDPETKKKIKEPTHDSKGARPEYLRFLHDRLKVFAADGTVKEGFLERLDPACIEAADFNLSASRHKPFTFDAGTHEKPAVLIKQLDGVHAQIREKLKGLLELVEGRK